MGPHTTTWAASGIDRRTLIVTAGAACVGGLLNAAQSTHPRTGTLDVSPADSLTLYVDLLRGVQTELLATTYANWNTAAEELSVALKALVNDLEHLGKVIAPAQMRSATTSLARIGSGLLRTSVSADARAGALVGYAQSVLDVASDWETGAQPLSLSPEAASLLRKIIDQAARLEALRVEADRRRTNYSVSIATIAAKLDSVRELLFQASGSIRRAADTGSASGTATALEKIREAIAAIQLIYAEASLEMNVGRVVLALLSAAEHWTAKGPQTASGGAQHEVAAAGIVPVQGASDIRSRLAALIDEHCPWATFLRIAWLISLMMPIWVAYSRPDERKDLIRGALKLFPGCHKRPTDSESFVEAIAKFAL